MLGFKKVGITLTNWKQLVCSTSEVKLPSENQMTGVDQEL